MEDDHEAELEHIGIKRRSGRYPWGSGNDPYQRSKDFKKYLDEMRNQGLTDPQIAEAVDAYAKANGEKSTFKTPQLRAAIAISGEEIQAENVSRAWRLRNDNKQMSTSAIGKAMGVNESTVRGWLKGPEGIREGSYRATAEALKTHLETKEFLDVGKGNHLYMGVSELKLKTAVAMLSDEGYQVWTVKNPQLGTGKMTTYKVLTKPGVPWNEARLAVRDGRVRIIGAQSDDGGFTFREPKAEPVSVNSKRVAVKWDEEGGTQMDGVIELRRGVADLDLGAAKYAQVRIAVDGSHYLKGMAIYADDMPNGVDVRFNTNKKRSTNKLDAMKEMKDDPENRFGATVLPKTYLDKKGKVQTSPLNIVYEEGQWDRWSRTLSSQFTSKQSVGLANTQLAAARKKSSDDLNEILSYTNPVVKKKLLDEYAEGADAAAVHLKAASLKGQATNVILPMNTLRPNEIYAPNLENGTKVVLVRHPHGGPFEIPELTVNNNNRAAKRILGGAKDAVGIHYSKAEQLSGADFDGDTVLVIPNTSGKVKTRPPLEGLKNFEPRVSYAESEGMKYMTKQDTQKEMGRISNLITDMNIKGANDTEMARAVRHSMVVIDAEKHKLNYKLSEKDHNIAELKEKYQGGTNRGAATIISRSGATERVPFRKYLTGKGAIDPKTGEKQYIETGKSYQKPIVDKKTGQPTGEYETVYNTTKGTKMGFAKDARDLLSTNPGRMEEIYADHANEMKALANRARRELVALQMPKVSPAAKAVYAKEIASLNEKLRIAERNAPRERRAQSIGTAITKARIEANPGLDDDDIKKIRYQSLTDARELTGANKVKIGSDQSPITPREWEAIQAGAIAYSKLDSILKNADMDRIRELATPRPRTSLTVGQLARAKQMEASGRTPTEIAEKLGLPRSTVVDNLKAAG